MLLFKLGLVAGDVDAADTQLDPVFRSRLFLNRCRGAVVGDRRFIIVRKQPWNCQSRRGPDRNGAAESRVGSDAFHLKAEVAVGLRTVDGFVTAGRPAGALLQPGRVIAVADENASIA